MTPPSESSSATPGNGRVLARPARLVTMTQQEDDSDYGYDTTSPETPKVVAGAQPLPYDPSLLPAGSRSLTSIAMQSFWLGFTFSFCLLATTYMTTMNPHPMWRLPAFFACLSLFHFLEFYITARYNLPAVRASSFLLFNNGRAYNVAHTLAATEILLSTYVLPLVYRNFLFYRPYTVLLGVFLVFLGQITRSVAMSQAGTNFNHTPAQTHREGHELVTSGVYRWLRHPSYFGFFWWALGTQVLIGNKVCLIGYTLALWKFFHGRIAGKYLYTHMTDWIRC